MSSRHADDLDFALQLAARAGELLMRSYEQVLRVDRKSKRDVVTDVDYASEALFIDAIRDRFPEDAILAEESGRHESAAAGKSAIGASRARWSRRTWVIDPLDGTVNYANGIPFFCVSLALVYDGQPIIGVVHDPTRDETFVATAVGSATLYDRVTPVGRTIVPSDKEKLSDFVVSLALSGRAVATRVRAVRKVIRISRSMGSAALALAYVGHGRFDAYIQTAGLSIWDIAAAGLIAERAGATVTDLSGGPWFDLSRKSRSIGVLAAPAAHHAALLELAR